MNNDLLPDCSSMLQVHARPSSPLPVRNVAMRREPFVMRRLLQCYPIEESRPLRVKETPDVVILEDLISYSLDIPEVFNAKPKIQAYAMNFRRNGHKNDAVYDQINYGDQKTDDYQGAVKIGRAYTKSALQTLPSGILKSLYKSTHIEVDIVAAYPSLCLEAIRDVEMPSLERWVSDEAAVVDDMRYAFEMSRKQVKRIVNTLICCGSSPSFGAIGIDDEAKLERVRSHPFIQGLIQDANVVSQKIHEMYPQFVEFCGCIRESNPRHAGDHHADRTAISLFLGDLEHMVMRNVLDALYPDGKMDNVVWRHDGVYIPRSIIGERSESEFVNHLSDVVFNKTSLRLRFSCKDLQEGSIAVTVGVSERAENAEYLRIKREFEYNHFYVKSFAKVCRLKPDLDIQILNKEAYSMHTAHMGDFGKKWLQDPDKLVYESIGMYPPPLSCPAGCYNIWKGFAADLLPENVNTPDISIFRQHLKQMAGGAEDVNEIGFQYLENTISHYLQKPGIKTGIAILFVSAQGTGKDLMADILHRVFGHHTMLKVGSPDAIFSMRNINMVEGKVLAVVSECEAKDMAKISKSELKTSITENKNVSDKKYEQIRVIDNRCNFWLFSNSATPLILEQGERRFVVFEVNGYNAQKPEYFQPLIAMKEDIASIRGIYDYYKSRDITGFRPNDRVVTKAYNTIVDASSDIYSVFVKKFYHQYAKPRIGQDNIAVRRGRLFVPKPIFLGNWLTYCEENKYCKEASPAKIKTVILTRYNADFKMTMDRHKTSEDAPPVVIVPRDRESVQYGVSHKYNGNMMVSFDVDIMEKVFPASNQEDHDVEYDSSNLASGFFPGVNN